MLAKHFVTLDSPLWRQCHASTVCATDGSDYLVAWFAGEHEGAQDSRIWLSRGAGDRWTEPVPVSEDEAPCWNPVLFRRKNGETLLYYKRGHAISSWETLLRVSGDGGLSWSDSRPLSTGDRGGRGPVKCPPIRLRSGRVLAGASTETWGHFPRWDAFVDISDDDGLTWSRTAEIALDRKTFHGAGIIQPALWESPSGQVTLMARGSSGFIVTSASSDQGQTWSAATATTVPNNNSAIGLCAFGGEIFLAHNPVRGDWASRAPLVVSRSSDDGRSWSRWLTLEESLAVSSPVDSGPSEGYLPADSGVTTTGANEFSYPTLITHDHSLVVTYTWQRRGIVLAHVPLAPNLIGRSS